MTTVHVCSPLGPCSLETINATSECNSGTILVEWKKTGDTSTYLVTAVADDNTVLSCNGSSSSCLLQGARCDMHYSVVVSSSSDKCGSLRSPVTKITTGILQSGHSIWIHSIF